ncbi:MAG: tetratricopeptide repeat protein [Alphaproteobacteria bacterium]|nr:tetratricopeptide repeat protein [Alphaproteobacteria bacterium]
MRMGGRDAPWLGALLWVLLLAACAAPENAAKAIGGGPETAEDAPMSALGSYLAGRHAQQEHDYAAAAQYFGRALAQDPGDYELLNKAFLFEVTEGHVEEAVRIAERIHGVDPAVPVPNLVLVLARMKAGDFAGADAMAKTLPRESIHRFVTPLIQAWGRAGLGRTNEAIAALAPIKDVQGFSPLADFHMGLIDDFAGRSADAESQYQNLMKSGQRGNWRTIEALGGLYERTGKADEARALYERFAGENPDSGLADAALARLADGKMPPKRIADAADGAAEALFDLASILNQGETADFSLIYARLALYLKPDFPLAQLLVGDVLESEHRPVEALAIDRSIASPSPYSWSARLHAASNLEQLGRVEEAAGELRAMAAEKPDRVQPLVQLGDLWRSKNRFSEAAAAYDDAVARIKKPVPADWTIFYSRGVALERAGDWPRAEADLLHALELQPEQPLVLNYLGYSWVDKGTKLSEALRMIERAVKLRPNDGYIVDSLGWAYYRLANYAQATQNLERAIELRPEDPTINDHLGDAYWRVGRLAEARAQWRRALQFGPEAADAKMIEVKLDHGLEKPGPNGSTAQGG